MKIDNIIAIFLTANSLREMGRYFNELDDREVLDVHLFHDGANGVWRAYVFIRPTPLALDGATAPKSSGDLPADVLDEGGELPEPPRQ